MILTRTSYMLLWVEAAACIISILQVLGHHLPWGGC
jgi:hypothetical protein